jgi:hypothetical protein
MVSINEAERSAAILHSKIYNRDLRQHIIIVKEFISQIKKIAKDAYENERKNKVL